MQNPAGAKAQREAWKKVDGMMDAWRKWKQGVEITNVAKVADAKGADAMGNKEAANKGGENIEEVTNKALALLDETTQSQIN